MTQQLLRVLKNNKNLLGDLLDYFLRNEFANQLSVHRHGLLWIKDAPRYAIDGNSVVIAFVDRYITCEIPDDEPELYNLVMSSQQHCDTILCKRRTGQPCKKNCKDDGICFKKRFTCCFNYPLPPMVYMPILETLNDEIYEEKGNQPIKSRWEKIKEEFSKSQSEAITFEKFLQNLKMTNDQYIEAVQSSLKTKRLFLKHSVSCSKCGELIWIYNTF